MQPFGSRLRTEGTVIMNIRPALVTGGSLALGVLALGAV